MSEEPTSSTPKLNPGLIGVSSTLLITVAARAADAAQPKPLLGDTWAKKVLDQVEYTPTTSDSISVAVVLRARLLDAWATEFLNNNPDATVLQLACGLDSRAHRLSWGSRVRWIDVDLPEVVELRKKLIPSPSGDYRLVASSVTESRWLEEIPADRPVLVIMEGLTAYLKPTEVDQLMRRMCDRFSHGQIIFDLIGWLCYYLQPFHGPTWSAGAKYQFFMSDPHALEKAHAKLRMKNVKWAWEFPGMESLSSLLLRFLVFAYSWLPGLRTYYGCVRYEF